MQTRTLPILAALLAAAGPAAGALPELLYVSEGNNLRRIDIDTLDSGAVLEEMVFRNASDDPERGRDINGMVCALPGDSALLLAAEDTAQPHPPAGWGVLTADGVQVGKLTATVLTDTPDPYGCAVDAQGRVFATETGRKFFGGATGQLILWFPPFVGFPGPPGAYPNTDETSAHYCKLATDLGTALGVAVDPDGRVYVAAASGREVVRFSPPFPTGPDAAGGCAGRDALGSPLAEGVTRERFLAAQWRHGLVTYSGLALAPNGNLYVSSVATGRIAEFDRNGGFVRMILDPGHALPPYATGYPQGLAVDSQGTLYYADLDLALDGLEVGPGPDGKVWRIRFDAEGRPGAPEPVRRGLAFPDAVSVLPGDLEAPARLGSPAVQALPPLAPIEPGRGGETGAALLLLGAVVVVTAGALALAWRRRRPSRL
jgi:DNA-binding beta-propeller fold protein YncE